MPNPTLPFVSLPAPVTPGAAAHALAVTMPDETDSNQEFASLYRKTLAPLRRYLTRLLSNAGEAQELAHDAYLRVFPMVANRTANRPAALLFLTARRLAINRLKHRSISSVAHEELGSGSAIAPTPGVAEQVMARQELSLLEKAVAQLPVRCRAVLMLRNLELLSHREISERLGIAISTVEKQHARALRLLRAAMPSETGHSPFSPAPAPDNRAES